jgi:hypothetical protein
MLLNAPLGQPRIQSGRPPILSPSKPHVDLVVVRTINVLDAHRRAHDCERLAENVSEVAADIHLVDFPYQAKVDRRQPFCLR